MENPELSDHIPFQNIRLIISTIAKKEQSISLIKSLERSNYQGKLFITAVTSKDFEALSQLRVANILQPHQMAAFDFYNSHVKDIVI